MKLLSKKLLPKFSPLHKSVPLLINCSIRASLQHNVNWSHLVPSVGCKDMLEYETDLYISLAFFVFPARLFISIKNNKMPKERIFIREITFHSTISSLKITRQNYCNYISRTAYYYLSLLLLIERSYLHYFLTIRIVSASGAYAKDCKE